MRLTFFIAVALAAHSAGAVAAGVFSPLQTPDAHAIGLSPDGSYAVAETVGFAGSACYRWTPDGAEVPVGALTCAAIATDGTIVGFVNSGPPDFDDLPIILPLGAQEPQPLPVPEGMTRAQARAIADTGQVVGQAADPAFNTRAFEWTTADGSVLLPVPADARNSAANAVSADGSVIVGFSSDATNTVIGIIWQNGEFAVPVDANGMHVGEASGVSANGRFVVGYGYADENGAPVAWRWDRMTNAVIALHGLASAYAVTDDGTRVTGDTGFLGNHIMMVWSEGAGAETVADYAAARGIARPFGWSIITGETLRISADGTTLFGCCGRDPNDSSLRSFAISNVPRVNDTLFADGFDRVVLPPIVQDPSFEATTAVRGVNPAWHAHDGNPAAAGHGAAARTDFRRETEGNIAAHSGLWTVMFGGWGNGFREEQTLSQDVVLPDAQPLYLNYWRFAAVTPDASAILSVVVDGLPIALDDLSKASAPDGDFIAQSVNLGTDWSDGRTHTITLSYAYTPQSGNSVDGRVFIDDVTIDAESIEPDAH